MKILKLIVFLLFAWIPFHQSAQLLQNGGFETGGGPNGNPSNYSFNLELASPWRNLNGTCDWVYPGTGAAGVPRTGDGCGRIGWGEDSSVDEYCYGRTTSLNAGSIYKVSFWVRKDYSNNPDYQVGAYISAAVPTPMVTSPTYIPSVVPQVIEQVTSTTYKKVTFCFSATQTGVHYLTFGSFKQNSIPVNKWVLFFLDDISVELVSSMPTPVISPIAANFCGSSPIVLNGTNSTGETEYEWDIYDITNGSEILKYNGSVQTGTAGTADASALLGINKIPGHCYRAYLTLYNGCEVSTFVEFCVVNPDVNFITDGNPVCENTPLDLEVTGDNGWTYTWSNNSGQLTTGTGSAFKTLTVTPTIGNSTYTVVVTTPEGCTHTETLNLVVNSQNNLAPWMDGINGTGEYTYYVNQGDAVFFNSVLSNDHPNEIMDISVDPDGPSGSIFSQPSTTGGIFSFSWVTSLATQTGEYLVTLTADDQNACNTGIGVFDFRIVVVCDQCPICISYEDRTPNGTPLPTETKAGKCIRAGFSQPVSTGTANVTFIAGATIDHGPFWDGGPGYYGYIDPTTCVTDCEDCCTDWAGFTYDQFPVPIILNFDDNDPTNDIFQLTDMYHPFCAFGAKGYHLEILRTNAGANPINSNTDFQTTACCPFESPAQENPIPHSSIWWDGYYTNMWGNQTRAEPQMYIYLIELYGCNGQSMIMHGDIYVQTVSSLSQNPNGQNGNSSELLNSSFTPEQQEKLKAIEEAREHLDKELSLFPNPTTDLVQISGIEAEDVYYQVFDDKGVMLSRREKAVNQSFSLTDYSKGTYYIRIYSGATYVVRKVVKM